MRVCFLLLASMGFVAALGAQVKSPSDKLSALPSTISGIMVKPASGSASAQASTTSSSSAATSSTQAKGNPIASLDDMENESEIDEDDQEDQVQAIPQPSSQSATLVPAASSDLKTAAGYHYPSQHEGAHHGGHHYGKYYQ